MKGFKNFLMRGSVVEVAVALVIALAFAALITAFTATIISPILAALGPNDSLGLGWQIRDGNPNTFVDIGGLITAFITFVVFMATIYFVIVLPFKAVQARRGVTVFGDPAPAKTCPACLSEDLAVAASKCKYCGTAQQA
ncbi:MAG TPA: MscL family protein [Motilibacterales bacterium]|nr:MscL family protein [Motilibacterales bacterium]